jgi:hypothetical protein
VDAGDEVGQEQWIGCRQPERPVGVDAVQLGEFGHVDHAQDHAGDGHQPEQHHAGFRLDVGGPHHELLDPQEQLAVGNRGLGPHLVRAQLEVVGQGGDAVLVRVEPLHHQAALPDVGVDVTAEQGDAEHHGQPPGHHCHQRRLAGLVSPHPDALAQPQPGADQEHSAYCEQDDGEGNAGASARIQMNSGILRSSETGASQPTPRDPISINIEPDESGQERRAGIIDLGPACCSSVRGSQFPRSQAQAPSSQDGPICCVCAILPGGPHSRHRRVTTTARSPAAYPKS